MHQITRMHARGGRRAVEKIYATPRFDANRIGRAARLYARVISNDNNVLEKFRSHGISLPSRSLVPFHLSAYRRLSESGRARARARVRNMRG